MAPFVDLDDMIIDRRVEWTRHSGAWVVLSGQWSGRGQTPLVTSCPALLLVVLDRDNEEDE